MSKTKKSKLLASMLCATVVAGLYAGPVMAGTASGLAVSGSNITAEDTVIINGVTLADDGITAANGKFKVYNDGGLRIGPGGAGNAYFTINGKTGLVSAKTFEADHITAGSISAGNKNFGIDQWGNVYIGENAGDFSSGSGVNAAIKLSTDGTIAAKSIAVEGASGAFKVKDIDGSDGNKHTMVFASSKTTGKDTLWLNTETGNLATNGSITVGGVDGTAVKTIIDGATGNIAVGVNGDGTQQIHLDAATGSITAADYNGVTLATNGTEVLVGGIDVKAMSDKTAGLERKTSGASSSTYIEGSVRINNNGGLEVLGKDGSTSTVASINRNGDLKANNATFNGNIIANGEDSVLRVGSLDGANVRAENGVLSIKNGGTTEAQLSAEGLTLGEKTLTEVNIGKVNGLFGGQHEDRPTIYAGDGSMVGGVQFSNGAITANSLTLDGLGDVGAAITDLQEEVGSVGGDLTDLTGKVGTLETNTAGITNDKGVTVIDKGLKVKGEDGREVFSVARDGAIKAVVTDGLGGTSANFALNGENVELKYGNNGITANIDGTTISGNGTDVVVNENGATFTNANGTTVINGGAITAETLNGKNIDELISGVDVTNANVAGIKRDGETTTIEETLSVSKDGISANVGSSQLIVNDEVAGMTSGNASLALTNNEASLSAAGNSVVVNSDGVTFNTTNNGTTVINGGAITADTLNGVDIDELISGVGETNANVAGIKRDGETTTIEEHFSVSSDGTIDAFTKNSTFSMTEDAIAFGVNGVNGIGSIAIQSGDITLHGNVHFTGNDGNSYTLADLEDRVSDLEDKTQNIDSGSTHGPSEPGEGEGPVDNGAHTGINGDVTVGGDLTVGGSVNAGEGNFDKVNVGGENGTNITGDKITIGNTNPDEDADDKSSTVIEKGDVTVTDKEGNQHSIMGNAQDIADIREDMGAMSNRISKVEDRIDKVGAMSAAIANLRTMGYDPTAPTEIAVGIGQYRSETGAALGLFHYPNKDFMLSLSVSTSGDEVMGGIGATWKFGRKSPEQMLAAEKEKAAKAKLAKAEAMKKAAAEAKVAEQQAKHAKMAAEKAAK